jgi:hypothetical protein
LRLQQNYPPRGKSPRFDALAGRNAHQVYLERESAMFE